MTYLSRQISIARAAASATYKEWAAYRTHSMVSIFVGPVYFLMQAAIWRAVYAGGGVGGMSLDQMIRYYGVSTLIHYLIMDFADWNLQMLIHTGRFLTFALRPMSHSFFALSQKIGHRALGFLFEFLPVLAIFVFLFGMDPRPASWPWMALSLMLGFLIQFYVNYSIGIAGFWLTRTHGLRSIVFILTRVCSGALFPLTLLPRPVQSIAFFLPFQFTVYVPSMVFAGHYSLGGISMALPQVVGLQAAYALILMGFSGFLFRLGMKRFTAVGA